MKHYLLDHWEQLYDGLESMLRIAAIIFVLLGIYAALDELLEHTQASLTILRDLRGEFRSAVGSSGPKESDEG